ncbi:MAG: hypothetical protein ACRDID_02555 [Ktedonobacterales bacterium]
MRFERPIGGAPAAVLLPLLFCDPNQIVYAIRSEVNGKEFWSDARFYGWSGLTFPKKTYTIRSRCIPGLHLHYNGIRDWDSADAA